MAHPVLQILNAGDIAELTRADRTDGQLIELFVKTRDPDAFATLVRRHGALVLGVCRRVLHNHADADDAFQAAFLVLARKAATINTRGLLAPWLHGVAYNTARKLRRSNARRALREQPLANVPEPVSDEGVSLRNELLAILDEELNQLPERYRVPIVLCDLEGSTRKEAARLIGCPEGTVAGRLARARALLAERLAGRGIAPTAGILAALLTQRAAGAIAPERVMATVRAVSGTVSIRVAELAERVVTAMFLTKLKPVAVVVLLCGLVVASVAGLFRADATATEPQAPFEKAAPAEAKKSAGEAKSLTVIPLRKLDADEAARVVGDTFKGHATVAAIPDERSLLLYADAKTTGEVRALLVKLGETTAKEPTLFRLKNANCTETAKTLREVFNGPKGESPRVTIVPVPDENAIIVYATPIDTLTIRDLLGKVIDGTGSAQPAPAVGVPEKEKTFAVNLHQKPWKDVLAWYEEISGYKFVGDVRPTGSLTLTPPKDRRFTIGEITDLLNEALVQQKMLLIRRQTTFVIHPADEKIDPTFASRVEVADLKSRGKTELVEVEIMLGEKQDAATLAPEVQKMLTPFGAVAYAKGNRLVVRDTAGNVARIVTTIRSVERDPDAGDPRSSYDPRFDPRFSPRQPEPKKFPVHLKEVPWDDVLEMFARESGLTPILTVKPAGRVTIQPPQDRKFTMGEVVDLLNEAMTQQKLILVRRQVSFFIHPTDQKLDISLIPRIELRDLSSYGKTELVQVLLPLKALAVEEAAPEIQRMLSPYGTVSMLVKTNTLVILDTAGNLQRIYSTIQEVEKESGPVAIACKYQSAQVIVAHLVKNFNRETDAKTFRVTYSADNNTVYVTGTPEQVARAKKIIEGFDVQKPEKESGDPLFHTHKCRWKKAEEVADALKRRVGDRDKSFRVVAEKTSNSVVIVQSALPLEDVKKLIAEIDKPATEPALRKYPVPAGTANAVANALLAEKPSLRIIAVQAANEIWVMATPDDHEALAAKLGDVAKGPTIRTEIIPIAFGEPKELALKLRKFFPSANGGPTIMPGFWGRSAIIVRGTPDQIKAISEALMVIEGTAKQK